MKDFLFYIVIALIITQLATIFTWLYRIGLVRLANPNPALKVFYKISAYFQLFNTLMHELFHIFMAYCTFNKGYKIELTSDRAGSAVTSARNKFSVILIKLSGYTGASLFVVFFMTMLNLNLYRELLYIIGGILIFSLIFYVRNAFGVYWCILMALALSSVAYYGSDGLLINVIKLLGAILVVESIASTVTIVNLSIKHPKEISDSSDLAKLTKIPSIIWSIFFLAFAVYCSAKGYQIAYAEPISSLQELFSILF